ncbi:PhzF family phenazine biosynthesis protein [Actinomadura namibiensis]|uniref:Putative PhzF superfamily epimerase YddE/YHI9 n=1 Tax=Actinomadura namibiensis TaxID=182080 RepID=A0A7W3LLR6_ACTNM|nr:PhzF family phenazine biosynthesis protein [Actinomadura namibiensis]MBA8950370.1 putative PhzF superfamily epimerase YddE/YHI9 [Actinomadura namibiensis]
MDVHVVRVFCDEDGRFGNGLGVVFDAAGLPGEAGPALTARLGFSETVFVDDAGRGAIRIFNPRAEMRMAGHPTVGVAWLVGEVTGAVPRVLRPRLAGEMETWREGATTWVRGSLADAPEWGFVQVGSPAEVEALPVPPGPEYRHHQFWAWLDEAAGVMRTRAFAAEVGVAEDEATGSAAMRQAVRHGRPLTVRQGRGSVIAARPAPEAGRADVGGRVVLDGVRSVAL